MEKISSTIEFLLYCFFKTGVVLGVVFWDKVVNLEPDTMWKLAAVALPEGAPNKSCCLSIHVGSNLLVDRLHIIFHTVLLAKQTAPSKQIIEALVKNARTVLTELALGLIVGGGLNSNGVFNCLVLNSGRSIVCGILLLFGIGGTAGEATRAFALFVREFVTGCRLLEGFIGIVADEDFGNRVSGLFLQDFNRRGVLYCLARSRGRDFTIMVVVHHEAATKRCITMPQDITVRNREGNDFDGLEGDDSMLFDYFEQILFFLCYM